MGDWRVQVAYAALMAMLWYIAFKVEKIGLKPFRAKPEDRIRWLSQVRGREAELREWLTVLDRMEPKTHDGLSDFYSHRNSVRWTIRQEMSAIELWIASGMTDDELCNSIDSLGVETREAISEFRNEYRDEDDEYWNIIFSKSTAEQ